MPAVHRHTDICTGHGCFGSRPNAEASSDVFANGLGAHRVGDRWETHCCGPLCHDGLLAEGSPTVFANGRPWGRIGDPVDCGSFCQTGSPDVFADG